MQETHSDATAPSAEWGSPSTLESLVQSVLGAHRAHDLLSTLEVPDALNRPRTDVVHRAELAMALAAVLFDDVRGRVPMAAAYVGDARRMRRRLLFDHGALRTVAAPCGDLPGGRAAVARLLVPLGYEPVGEYPLQRLHMTGHAYASRDLPTTLPQYFVSEFHPDDFSPAFQEAAARVVGTSRDPLTSWAHDMLADLRRDQSLPYGSAAVLLPILLRCFARHHSEPTLADYETLLAESAEMAWIATEGQSFNHATDRVADVAAVADEQRRLGRPIKDALEVSASGRVIQTAFRAATVQRIFVGADGTSVARDVPGSFHEFITRKDDEDGQIDLRFDSSNAQGIFKMTDQRVAS